MKRKLSGSVAAFAALVLWSPPLTAPAAADDLPSYKPPPRGAPGGRVGGASRGINTASLPTIELLSPDGIAGQTAQAAPTVYYFVSTAPPKQLTLTVSAPNVARPLVETSISARGAGVQAVRLADYGVQLQPGIVYTWSVSLPIDAAQRSKDVVASASILRAALDPSVDSAARAAPTPVRRASILAQAGFWYDALAAAAEANDRHAALDALLDQVGLRAEAAFDRQAQGGR